jgi:tetratricopeptide (TPR) repeat protein
MQTTILDHIAELAEQKQYQQIIDLLPDNILTQHDDPELWRQRSDAWYFLDDHDKALKDLDKALALDPGDAWSYYSRGIIRSEKKDYYKAIDDYTKFLQLEPYEDIGYSRRGDAWHSVKEFDKAILDYTMAIGIDPTVEYYWFDRGDTIHDKLEEDPGLPEKEIELAIKDYGESIRLNPLRQESYCYRGILLAVLERDQEASKDLEKALALDPTDDVARESLQFVKKKLTAEDAPTVMLLSEKDMQTTREKAASFLDKLRKHLDAKFKKAKEGYQHGFEITSYDEKTQRPLVAGIQGWLPEIMPDLARWEETVNEEGGKTLDVCTPDGQEFWPSLAGIPITDDLWLAIVGYKQYLIGESPLNRNVRRFPNVNLLLMRIIGDIRKGHLDNELIFHQPA